MLRIVAGSVLTCCGVGIRKMKCVMTSMALVIVLDIAFTTTASLILSGQDATVAYYGAASVNTTKTFFLILTGGAGVIFLIVYGVYLTMVNRAKGAGIGKSPSAPTV